MSESYRLDLTLGNKGWLTVDEGPDLPDCDYVFVAIYGPLGGNTGTLLLTPDQADALAAFLEAKAALARRQADR